VVGNPDEDASMWIEKCGVRRGTWWEIDWWRDNVGACNALPYTSVWYVGCAKAMERIVNIEDEDKWCTDPNYNDPEGRCINPCTNDPLPVSPDWVNQRPACNLSLDERFDLDRDGTEDVDAAERENFHWQWFQYGGFNTEESNSWDFTRYQGYRGYTYPHELDVDGDGYEESVIGAQRDEDTGWLYGLYVLDRQMGDLDFSRGDEAPPPVPGLDKETTMYTRIEYTDVIGGDYTALEVEEGKLYTTAPDHQFVRYAQTKDQVDVVERIIQLSNNTCRFCTMMNPAHPTHTVGMYGCYNNFGYNEWFNGTPVRVRDPYHPNGWAGGAPGGVSIIDYYIPNPVDVCCNSAQVNNCCHLPNTIHSTCMDTNPNVLKIYVRSRVKDLHGRKWITDVSDDEHMDLSPPP